MRYVNISLMLVGLIFFFTASNTPVFGQTRNHPGAAWPETSSQTRPWTRWWWHGNAVTAKGITSELESLKAKGFGGVEITPIYGVVGEENRFITYLSDAWIDLLIHTLAEAHRLDLGVDMATGTGWPFGGPWIDALHASRNIVYQSSTHKGGSPLVKKIKYVQQPLLRTVRDSNLRLDNLVEPITDNKNLQALALDQVRFATALPLLSVMAYSEGGNQERQVVELTHQVSSENILHWNAPEGNWTVYEVFQGWHGKLVERAAPGGEGYAIDHFSKKAITQYLKRFDVAFENKNTESLRAFFNDSYEVDDAIGSADWTPDFFSEFQKRRAYDLKNHLPELFAKTESDSSRRILSDYRETISELIGDSFTQPWVDWAHSKKAIVRNQAHGSPANILDLYARVDIPETEGIEPLRTKMASSAGNVSGKKLVSAESATWLKDHFQSSLSDIKQAVDQYFLNGVNHIFYHGTAYSPDNDVWPGWLFYAAVHMNDRNPLWKDVDALNSYITRTQSFLQNSQPNNDILLYFPIYDRFATPGSEMIEHFDELGDQFTGSAFKESAEELLEEGYTFDYISDKQIAELKIKENRIQSANSFYKTLIVPAVNYIPLATIENILALANQGARVVFYRGLPKNIAGYFAKEEKTEIFSEKMGALKWQQKQGFMSAVQGLGLLVEGDNLDNLLQSVYVTREPMVDRGLRFLRKKYRKHTLYFINNRSADKVSAWIELQALDKGALIFDPVSEEYGHALTKSKPSGTGVYLQIKPQESLIVLTTEEEKAGKPFPFYTETHSQEISGTWKVKFLDGGPEIPKDLELEALSLWTDFSGSAYQGFSGTAQYSINFSKPDNISDRIKLDFGVLMGSASVSLNGRALGTLLGPDYSLEMDSERLGNMNKLEVAVSNRMANRIIELGKKSGNWKKFYNINFPAIRKENRGADALFSTQDWQPLPAGLAGPVRIVNLKKLDEP